MTAARHLKFLIEEPSMETFLRGLLPRVLPEGCTFECHVFRGKQDLLRKLESRLRGYRRWLPNECRLVVVVDRDNDDCHVLKTRLERAAAKAGLLTRSRGQSGPWQVVSCIAIEELEAWYFGDWKAVRQAYPRVSPNVAQQDGYRDPDAVRGGTWEAFERILNGRKRGYFRSGLRKTEAARAIAPNIDPARNRSRSFAAFRDALAEAAA